MTRTRRALLLAGCTLLASSAAARAQVPGQWAATGSMATARAQAAIATLPNGLVLVAGGIGRTGSAVASAELYDPSSGTWTPTASMTTARDEAMTVTLGDGDVLVLGGLGSQPLASAEEYNPTTATWTAAGAMATARVAAGATLLSDGDVLVAGGLGPGLSVGSSAELFNPLLGTWSSTGAMSSPRAFQSSTLMSDGDVLAAGGISNSNLLASAELYDPASGRWIATGSLHTARAEDDATPLGGGVLVAGGGVDTQVTPVSSAEVYNPAAGTWTRTGSMTIARAGSTASPLTNGEVLVAGGKNTSIQHSGALSSAELFNPANGTWAPTGTMPAGVTQANATVLPSGRVLVAGGDSASGTAQTSAEIYQPAIAPQVSPVAPSAIAPPTADLAATLDPEGSDTTEHFDLSTTPDFAAATSLPAADVGAASAPGAVTAQATGLLPGTTYDVRLVAANASGTSVSPTVQFSTASEAPAGLPVQTPGAPAKARVLSVRRTARGGVRVSLTVSRAGRITMTLVARRRNHHTHRFHRSFKVGAGDTVHAGRAADRWLRRLRHVRAFRHATLTITYSSGSTHRRVLRRTITLHLTHHKPRH